jgi:serine/threonine protein kinase
MATGAGAVPWDGMIQVSALKWCLENGRRIELGSGANGTVYAARYAGEDVAAKLTNTTEVKFLNELRLQAAQAHRHVVLVHGPCVEHRLSGGPLYYIVMERMAGSLKEVVLHPSGSCSSATIRDRLRWLLQICKALRFMHLKGVLHGDLKPDNVMLEFGSTSAGTKAAPTSSSIVKVTDFGFSRIRHEMGSFVTDSAKGEQGTPLYMDPKLWDSSNAITRASDIYSFGIMAWHLLTGRTPFSKDLYDGRHRTDLELMERLKTIVLVEGKRPELETLLVALQGGGLALDQATAVTDLLVRCWAADPAARPTSELLEERLAIILAEVTGVVTPEEETVAPVVAPPDRSMYAVRGPPRRDFDGWHGRSFAGMRGMRFADAGESPITAPGEERDARPDSDRGFLHRGKGHRHPWKDCKGEGFACMTTASAPGGCFEGGRHKHDRTRASLRPESPPHETHPSHPLPAREDSRHWGGHGQHHRHGGSFTESGERHGHRGHCHDHGRSRRWGGEAEGRTEASGRRWGGEAEGRTEASTRGSRSIHSSADAEPAPAAADTSWTQ